MRIVRKIFLFAILVGLIAFFGYYLYCNITFSEGTRAGTLLKISKKGYLFKTYEGDLNTLPTGVISSAPDGSMPHIWQFSALNEKVFKELQKYEGKNVVLHHKQKIKTFPWQGDTNHLVWKVDGAENNNTPPATQSSPPVTPTQAPPPNTNPPTSAPPNTQGNGG